MIIKDPQTNTDQGLNYLSRYGLSCNPFALEYSKEFFLIDDERSKRLNILSHLIQHSDLLLLVTGTRGIGKTSMLMHFLGMATESWVTCHIQSHTMLHPDVLYRHISEAFKIEPADSLKETRQRLQQRLSELTHGDYIPILLIDDAHELPAESLREIILLSEMTLDDNGLIRTVLFSEPQIDRILETPLLKDIRNRITHTLDIPALDEKQTYQYIKHRLVTAGLHGDVPITDKKIHHIYRQSEGIPLAINRLATAELSESPETVSVTRSPKPRRSTKPLKPVFILLSIILIAGLITAAIIHDVSNRLWKDEPDQWANDEENRTIPKISINKPKPVSPAKSDDNTESDLPNKQPVPVEKLPLVDLDPGITADTNKSDTSNESRKEQIGQIRDNDEEVAVLVEIPAYSSKDKRDNKAVANDTNQDTTASINNDTTTPKAIADKPAPEAKIISAEASKTTTKNKPENNDTSRKLAAADKTAVKPKTATQKAASTQPSKKLLTGTAWLRAQNKSHYTIQLNASRSEASLQKYIKQYKLAGKATYVRTTLTGKNWFILLYGSYKDKQAANKAISQLPLSLRKVKPWSRRMGDIKLATP